MPWLYWQQLRHQLMMVEAGLPSSEQHVQDKTVLEARCKELQGLLEQTQGQRSEHRQALKVRSCLGAVQLQVRDCQVASVLSVPAGRSMCFAATCAVQGGQNMFELRTSLCLHEERAAREAAEAHVAESSTQHQHELQQLREKMQAQLEGEADSRRSVETQLGSLQSELQVSARSNVHLQPYVCPNGCHHS